MRKLRKNKFVVLVICVIVVSLVYFGVQKAIDNYVFKMNGDIISESERDFEDEEGVSDLEWKEDGSENESIREELDASSNEISQEEIDLALEETESGMVEKDGVSNLVSEGSESESENIAKIYVYITGEVNVPGVVILNEGSRIVDAINAAGGTTIKANVSKVNLVYVLDDGMKVNIPNDNDLKNNSNFEYITMNSGDGGRTDYSDGDSSNTGNSSAGNSLSSASESYKKYGVVNINTATQTELETLPGIGPSLALKIINYRKENGKFSSIDEIKNVSGIGDSKFEDLKSYITV